MLRNSFFSNMPQVTKNLLIINIIVWAFMAFIPAADHAITKNLALYYFTSPGFRPWQLFSFMFLHANFSHLFFNMFALLIFGATIERSMGSVRFLFYYLTCGLCAALVQEGIFAIYVQRYTDLMLNAVSAEDLSTMLNRGWDAILSGRNYSMPELGALNAYVNTPLVGASGAVYGVLLAFGFLYPNQPVYLMFVPIPIKAKWLVMGYFVIEFVSGISTSADGVAHFAHLGGMVFGFLLLLYWKKKGVFNNRWFF